MTTIPHDYLARAVCVVGAGTLGRRIALMFAIRGGTVHITDPDADQGNAAVGFVAEQLPAVVAAIPDAVAGGTARYVADLAAAVANAWLVVEAVPERLELKRRIFAELEKTAPADAIIATNSSSYASRPIVDGLETTERMLNIHFYMPPQKVAVDVMSCGDTAPEVVDFVMNTLPRFGLRPFLARRESTGFIYNRIWAAVKREALQVVYEGVSAPEDVDAMYRLQTGSMSGPFRMMDMVGLDVVYDIENHYATENTLLSEGPRILLRRYLDAGKLGVKTCVGFYDYRGADGT